MAKRRTNVNRYPSGEIVKSEQIHDDPPNLTVLTARVRRLWGVEAYEVLKTDKNALEARLKAVDDRLLGTSLGRLAHLGKTKPENGISPRQFGAGSYFGWLYRVNAKLRGWPSPNPRALDYGASSAGFSVNPEDSPEWIDEVKSRWGDMYREIIDADGRRGRVFEILKRVLLEDLDLGSVAELGDLRLGLNAICRAKGDKT